jgi:hypothetical protein
VGGRGQVGRRASRPSRGMQVCFGEGKAVVAFRVPGPEHDARGEGPSSGLIPGNEGGPETKPSALE